MPYITEQQYQRQQRARKRLLALSEIGLGILLGIGLAFLLFLGVPT